MKSIHNIYTMGQQVPLETIQEANISYVHQAHMDENYTVTITPPNNITIHYGHPRSKQYAVQSLSRLIQSKSLYYGFIEDGPSFPLRGIIEGFYGEPWTHSDRLDVLSFLEQERMNTYMYAPKDDLYHRAKWRLPYPPDKMEQLKELIETAQNKLLDFVFTISPGNDFNFTQQEDFDILFQKIDSVTALGVNQISILLDDINYNLSDSDLKQFKTPGIAHAYICNKVQHHLEQTLPAHTLFMCPTEYWQLEDSPYHNDLRDLLDDKILVFWTGYRVVPEYIPNRDGEIAKQLFGHNLVLWENYPVNDFATNHIFMGPLENRGDMLHQSHIGMVSNPMIPWSLSKLSLMTVSDYMWNPSNYDKEISYKDAISRFVPHPDFVLPFTNIMELFRPSLISGYRNETLWTAVTTKNIDTIYQHYQMLQSHITVLRTMPNPRFLEQIEPWFQRIEFDVSLLRLYLDDDLDTLKTKLDSLQNQKHDLKINYILLLFQELGLYEIQVKKRKLTNKWEYVE